MAARQMGYDARDAARLSGRGPEGIGSALGQKPQSAHPRITQHYCQKASGYPENFTPVSSHTHTRPSKESSALLLPPEEPPAPYTG